MLELGERLARGRRMSLLRRLYADPTAFDLVEHVLANVAALLETRRDHASPAAPVGLDDAYVSNEPLRRWWEMARQTREDLTRFEPRVQVLDVAPETDPATGQVHLRLRCVLLSTGETFAGIIGARGAARLHRGAP